MEQYRRLLRNVLDEGELKPSRAISPTTKQPLNTLALFGPQTEFNLADGFPATTGKKLFFRGVVEELLWFLRGSTNVKELQDKNVHIWDEWADADGELGPVYGHQWVRWGEESAFGKTGKHVIKPGINQIKKVVDGLRRDPHGRRHIVSAWNVAEIDKMKLPPCHCFFHFIVLGGKLHCKMYIRSNDLFLGAPFNIASYALLQHMIAQVTNLPVGRLVYSIGDAHIYENHVPAVEQYLSRSTKPLPVLHLNPDVRDVFKFRTEDILLKNYESHPAIQAEIAV